MKTIIKKCKCREESIDVDDDAWVATDFLCVKCGYVISIEVVSYKDEE